MVLCTRTSRSFFAAKQIKTKEEAALFSSMKGINPQLIERLSQRLFFVVNKADVKHVCEGEPVRGTIHGCCCLTLLLVRCSTHRNIDAPSGLDEPATQAYVADLVRSMVNIYANSSSCCNITLLSCFLMP